MNAHVFIVVALLVINWLVSLVVELINLKNFPKTIPHEFKDVFNEDDLHKSQKYENCNTIVGEVESATMLVITLLFIVLGGISWLQDIVMNISGKMIVQGLLFFGILFVVRFIVGTIFSAYDTFVIEEKFGFNKTKVLTFIRDRVVSLVLSAAISSLILAVVIYFLGKFHFAWLWSWIALSIIQFFLIYISPIAILPLFNKFIPLEKGELRDSIQRYIESHKFNIEGIYKIDASKRSTKTNAYFTGLGKTKRIALFDTLLEKLEVKEIVSILAHEVGHSKLRHLTKKMLFSLASTLFYLFLLSLFVGYEALYTSFGVDGTPVYVGMFLFVLIFKPVSMILNIVISYFSRKYEYEADRFAVKTTGEPEQMISSLKKLSVDNLSNLKPHPLKVFFEYSHPPVLYRIKAIREVSEGSTDSGST